MIELAVFDLAGTTVHDGDAVGSCFRAALAGAGVKVEAAAVNAVMGLPKPEAVRRLLAGAGGREAGANEVDAIHADFVKRMMDYSATDPAVREIEGAGAVFARLRQAGVRVALNTGFSRPIVRVILERLGWSAPAVIDASLASDEVPRGRPYPDMIRHLMRQLSVTDASRVAKIGDTAVDLEEGTNAGCGLVIGVTTGSFSRAELLAYPHTHILSSILDVPTAVLTRISSA
jgi:phosphonatase-like hydrolase